MGLKMRLPKENNFLAVDFENAYWNINDVALTTDTGVPLIEYNLVAYPSREACKMIGTPVQEMDIGSALYRDVNSTLHIFRDGFEAKLLFPDSVPTDINLIKTKIYEHLKTLNMFKNAEDVLEN